MKTVYRFRTLILTMVILIVFIIFGLIYEHGGHRLDIADANPLSEG